MLVFEWALGTVVNWCGCWVNACIVSMDGLLIGCFDLVGLVVGDCGFDCGSVGWVSCLLGLDNSVVYFFLFCIHVITFARLAVGFC